MNHETEIIATFSNERFRIGHEAFLEHMCRKSNGVSFTSFNHPFLIDDEIAYKWKVYTDAKDALSLHKWQKWRPGSGKILEATKAACASSVCANLLEHRFGSRGNSDSPLYRVETPEQVIALERELFRFLKGGPPAPESFGLRFDQCADFLRAHRLGCKWPFFGYLAFLLHPQLYFPVAPGPFQRLLKFYSIEAPFAGRVEWKRYQLLLQLADLLKEKLAVYGTASAVDVQSYMWVVSYLIKDVEIECLRGEEQPDFEYEFRLRSKRAEERERIGLLGEQFVFNRERQRLHEAGGGDLAHRVRLVSAEDTACGYDVLSFDLAGNEWYIEVKTTTRSPGTDRGFWMSEVERERAEKDSRWKLYRVWDIDKSPHFADLGNLVQDGHPEWEMNVVSWYATKARD
jgi:hypothetical protein